MLQSAGIRNSGRAPRHPITQDLPAKTNAAFQCSILRARLESNPAPITPIRRGQPQPPVSTPRMADPQHEHPNSDGAPGHPIPSKKATHQHSFCTPVQYLGSASQNPILPSPAPTTPDQPKATHPPISTPRMGQPATPFRGAPGTQYQESYSSSPYCSPVQYPREGHDFQADFYEAR